MFKLKKIISVASIILILGSNCFAANFNMAYIHAIPKSKYIEYIDRTNSSLNEVSPSYFDLNTNGTLKLTTAVDQLFIDEMHKRDILVVPFLSNHWDRELGRKALANKVKLVEQIATAIDKYNLDGINVDIENVSEADREDYTEFVKMLRERLGKNKKIAVAVAANPRGFTKGWHGSYDYEGLAKHADYLMLMTYDEHYSGGKPGPIASYQFVENSIKYALERVDKEKIVVGIPFFGRYWDENDKGGKGVKNELIDTIVKHYKGETTYDEATKSVKAVVKILEDSPKHPDIKISPGTYTFWYENDQSIKEKIELVNKYGLKGTGIWALGQEVPTIWESYKDWLYNGEFADLPKDKWSTKYVKYVTSSNIMVSDKYEFKPERKLTRAEAASAIARAFNVELSNDSSNELIDISDNWAKLEIEACASKGIITGYPDKSFKPNYNITREEFVAILNRLDIKYEDITSINTGVKFTDVSKNNWSYNNIMTAAKVGILSGYEDRTFKPKNNITREEAAKIIYTLLEKINKI